MANGGDVKTRAVAAIGTAIDTHNAARSKTNQVIAMKDFNGEDTSEEQAERARLDVEIGNLEDEKAEYQAAATVIRAPTQQEISAVQARVREIRDLAVAEAALQAGKEFIVAILQESIQLKNKNAKT